MIRAAFLGFVAGGVVTAAPFTLRILALPPFERDWFLRKDPR